MSLESLNSKFKIQTEQDVRDKQIELALRVPLQYVYGYGPKNAKVILIGEAPGKDEVKYGRPFVGKAGAVLDNILNKTGIKREELYITNVIKYRLMKEGSKKGCYKNRPATSEEINIMLQWLKEEIDLINPVLILTLGNVPLKALSILNNCGILKIGDCHGKPFYYEKATHIPLYHPAGQIYNRDLKAVFEEDFKRVREFLQNQEG